MTFWWIGWNIQLPWLGVGGAGWNNQRLIVAKCDSMSIDVSLCWALMFAVIIIATLSS